MTAENRDKVIQALEELQSDSGLFIKVYFKDKDNYAIKFIDDSGQKVHTMRKTTNRRIKGFDNNWWRKTENGKS